MRIDANMLILACATSIVCGCASAGEVKCSSTAEVSSHLRLVETEAGSREGLELIGHVSDCLRARSESGTIADIGDPVIDQLIDLLNNDDDGIRGGAALSLGWFGPRAKRAIPALDRAYIRIGKEISKRFVVPASASDADIVAALERITGKSGSQLELPPISDDSK
jgi:hypothetical protein